MYHFKQLQRVKFGSTSERFTELFDGQQVLFEKQDLDPCLSTTDDDNNDDDDDDDDPDPDPKAGVPVKGHIRQTKNKVSTYDHLPTKEEIILVNGAEKMC